MDPFCLTCPVCKFDYNHILRVEVDQGGELVEVAPDGVGFGRRQPARAVRGSIVSIEFLCEQGHKWAISFRFHKGQTFCHAQAQPGPVDVDVPTLWRD